MDAAFRGLYGELHLDITAETVALERAIAIMGKAAAKRAMHVRRRERSVFVPQKNGVEGSWEIECTCGFANTTANF